MEGKVVGYQLSSNGDYNPQTSVFIRGLPEDIKEQDLVKDFEKFGFILSVLVSIGTPSTPFLQIPFESETRKSKGIAFIDFIDEQAA